MSPSRPSRSARVRRLLGDLAKAETRGDAIGRIRRRAGRELGTRVGGDVGPRPKPAARSVDGNGRHQDAWYVGEWQKLADAALGAPDVAADDATRSKDAQKAAARQRAEALLAEAIGRGEPLETAVPRTVGVLADLIEHHAAWALAEGTSRLPGGETASTLALAVLWHRRRQLPRVWSVLQGLDDATLAQYVPIEAVDGALATGTDDARRRAIAIAAPTDSMDASTLIDLAGRFIAFGERDAAASLLCELRRKPSVELDARQRAVWPRLERWLDPPTPTIPEGAVPIAVFDYQSPDHVLTSGNLGDYVQTLSMLGNLVRLSDVTFTGEDGLGDLANELQGRVHEELRVPGVRGQAHLIPVDRDVSTLEPVPPGTWAFAFGWHMHPLFDLRYDFPYHPNLRPLFLSFHVNRLEILSDEALAYLRDHGPIGCRDWTTVFLLLSAGVDAFFSGCFTTSVDALFPRRAEAYRGGGAVGVIDLPPHVAGQDAANVRTYSHQADGYQAMGLAQGLRAADRALAGYQRDLGRAVTGRLHAFLPLTALGVPVEFRTGSPGDIRFAGLTDLTPDDPRLVELRRGIRDLTAPMLELILAGAAPADVYARWRELTREQVAEARRRFDAPVAALRTTTIDIDGAVATVKAGTRRFGAHEAVDPASVSDLVLAFDENLTWPAAVLLESVIANAGGPVRLWVLARGLTDRYYEWLAGAFPQVPMTFLPCDGIAYGPKGRPRRVPARITVSTMDRLLLPALLEDVSRVVYLDVDTLMLDDLCRLAQTDLGGRPIAARDSVVSEASEWQRSGRALPEPQATELRRAMGRRHGFGHAALNAGVLVMDLDRMRADDFTATYLGWVETYGLHDQDTMLAYVGPDRAVLDPRWNAIPTLEEVRDPFLIHWASFNKPWDPAVSFRKDVWASYAARVRERAGDPPRDDDSPSGPEGSLRNPVPIGIAGERSPKVEAVIEAVRAEHLSYLDEPSLRTLAATVEQLEADGIPGLIVEAGTALGGSAITLASAKSPERPMRVYDVFGMIPPPSDRDGADVHRRYATIEAGGSKGIGGDTYYGYRDDLLGEVTRSFARHGVPVDVNHVELIQGLFQDTIEGDEPVALAHLDGDWYASTMTCLTRLAPRLSMGGRIVVDDYDTWSGCRTAVHEYFTGRPGYRFERRGRLHIVRE